VNSVQSTAFSRNVGREKDPLKVWFGFNAGSAPAARQVATSELAATHFAAATATLGWLRGRLSTIDLIGLFLSAKSN